MIKKILFPTDFSDVANKALGFIKNLRQCGAEAVVVLHVLDNNIISPMEHFTSQYALHVTDIARQIEDESLLSLNAIADELTEEGYHVTTRLEHGNPFATILRIEEEEDVSMIVIGSHGRSNIAEMLLGSVSEKVMRKARKPVTVVKR